MPDFSDQPANPALYLPEAAPGTKSPQASPGDLSEGLDHLIQYIEQRGFSFEPWHVAAFITAVRTKPFVILAGISGTGKTQLPQLVAEGTGAKAIVVPVRPDWTDSSDLLGYERLTGEFVPGHLLQTCKEALENQDDQYFFVLDEMNIARVEYYLAEVLSAIESREHREDGKIETRSLNLSAPDDWSSVHLPSNVAIVGTVNMDETTHGFSRKVLDRSFVLELSDIDLATLPEVDTPYSNKWSVDTWASPYLRLTDTDGAEEIVTEVISALTSVNEILALAQLQVGYRIRDEVSLFCVNAMTCQDLFTTSGQEIVSPLDLSLSMKILPRIQGGGGLIRQILDDLLSWAHDPTRSESGEGISTAALPMTKSRLEMMRERLQHTGFTTYWY